VATRQKQGENDYNMCEKLTILTEHTAFCTIAQCEHGTVHIHWQHLTIHLCEADFLALTRVVADAYAESPQCPSKMRLGIGDITLEIAKEDCQPMIKLMRRAAAQLTPVVPSLPPDNCTTPFLFSAAQYLN